MNLTCDFWEFGLSNKLLLWWTYIIFFNFSLCTLWITRIKAHKGRYETFKDVHMTFWSLISPIFTIYFYHMFQAYIWLMLFFKFVLNDQIHLENSRTGKWKTDQLSNPVKNYYDFSMNIFIASHNCAILSAYELC